jgi:hypothetical protein
MQIDILSQTNRSGDYQLIMTAIVNGASSAITMPEDATYGDMQKATLTGTTFLLCPSYKIRVKVKKIQDHPHLRQYCLYLKNTSTNRHGLQRNLSEGH